MLRLTQFHPLNSTTIAAGLLTDDGMVDLTGRIQGVQSVQDIFADWESFRGPLGDLQTQKADYSLDQIKFCCPVPLTAKTICIGLNYRDHAIESGMAIPDEPVVFNKLPGALCGHDDPIPLPDCSSQVDYEAELVIVIGKRAHNVSQANALEHIFGYTCGHDVSARDWQIGRPGGQWLLGKSFPRFAPIGPAIVPSEFIADPGNLQISLRVGGETLQSSSTKQLIFAPAELIAHLSKCCVLEPGDVIFTGTPPGVGMARKPQRFLQDGDIAEVEIEGLGVLRNSFHHSRDVNL